MEKEVSMREKVAKVFLRAQKYRVALEKMIGELEVPQSIVRIADTFHAVEEAALEELVDLVKDDPVYQWLTSIRGIGRGLAAQVMGFFPAEKFSSPGKMWALAGLVPGRTNYSRAHKLLTYKLSMSQIMSNGDYRPFYEARKRYEWQKNLAGEYADQARAIAKRKGGNLWGLGKVNPDWARSILQSGKTFPHPLPQEAIGDGPPMLQPAHIESRARRWMVKLLLDHYFQVAYWYRTGEKWVPYAIAHGGHVDKIEPVKAPWLIPPIKAPWDNRQSKRV